MKYVGWFGVFFGFWVAPFQIYQIVKTGITAGISIPTYICLCLAMMCYLCEAIKIKSKVFITAQALNLTANIIILILIIGQVGIVR